MQTAFKIVTENTGAASDPWVYDVLDATGRPLPGARSDGYATEAEARAAGAAWLLGEAVVSAEPDPIAEIVRRVFTKHYGDPDVLEAQRKLKLAARNLKRAQAIEESKAPPFSERE